MILVWDFGIVGWILYMICTCCLVFSSQCFPESCLCGKGVLACITSDPLVMSVCLLVCICSLRIGILSRVKGQSTVDRKTKWMSSGEEDHGTVLYQRVLCVLFVPGATKVLLLFVELFARIRLICYLQGSRSDLFVPCLLSCQC